MWGAGPVPEGVGCTAQAAAELSPCGNGQPFGEGGTATPRSRETAQRDAESWAALGSRAQARSSKTQGKAGTLAV